MQGRPSCEGCSCVINAFLVAQLAFLLETCYSDVGMWATVPIAHIPDYPLERINAGVCRRSLWPSQISKSILLALKASVPKEASPWFSYHKIFYGAQIRNGRETLRTSTLYQRRANHSDRARMRGPGKIIAYSIAVRTVTRYAVLSEFTAPRFSLALFVLVAKEFMWDDVVIKKPLF